jgi:hypothetical protein
MDLYSDEYVCKKTIIFILEQGYFPTSKFIDKIEKVVKKRVLKISSL